MTSIPNFCLTFVSGVQKWDHLKANELGLQVKEDGAQCLMKNQNVYLHKIASFLSFHVSVC
jgi:hypothetical protein